MLHFRGSSDSPAIPRCHKEWLKMTARSGFLVCCVLIKWDSAWLRSCVDGAECKRSQALAFPPPEEAEEMGRPLQLCCAYASLHPSCYRLMLPVSTGTGMDGIQNDS